MSRTATRHGMTIALVTLVAAVLAVGSAGAQTPYIQYLDDGAVQNTSGGWDLPAQGTCPADLSQATRPECLALRFPAYTTATTCTAANGSWSSSFCNDLVNNADQATCESHPDRLWSNGICSIVMMDDDRNNVVCGLHGGTWGTTSVCIGNWVMPNGTAYYPPPLNWNGTSAPGTGDQCLRCHNTKTQYNGPRVRDTEDTMFMGHKNMARRFNPDVADPAYHLPWGGPPFHCVGASADDEESCYHSGGNWVPEGLYPGTDTGQDFDWVNGTVKVNGVDKPLYWIYADWLSALPRAVYADDPDTSVTPNKPKVSYSCARCHTTGWASSATQSIYGMGTDSASATREPENSYPGITWDGVANATTGQVNLAGGVTGDTSKMASWDVFGITCSRCHSSAILRTSTNQFGFSSPTGMSSHHSSMTGPDAGSGYCADTRWSNQTTCDAAGSAWLTACSIAGVCSNPVYTTSGSCLAGAGTWTAYTTSGACTGAGGTWYTASCNVAGICNVGTCSNPAYTNKLECDDNGGSWTSPSNSTDCTTAGGAWYTTSDIIRCDDAGGHYTGTKTQRGQLITELCAQCHRQETGGLPYDANDPAGHIKVGPYHGTVTFLSHPAVNQYLNSPHAKFSGAFSQIGLGKFNYAMTGEYKSFFMTEAEAGNTGNGCTGCHEVHTSTVTGESPFREECTECHTKNLDLMLHPSTRGTPLEHKDTEPMEACVSCHMPGGQHLFRINVDPAYSTFPASALTTVSNANTSADGNYASAVWVDLDYACGKCHGGGSGHVETTGTITANTDQLTVAAGQGGNFTVGQRVEIEGAGALYYDDDGISKLYDNFESFVKSIAGDVITLAGKPAKGVTNAPVAQNPTKNGAGYMTKTALAGYARGIHNDAPVANFTYQLGNPNTLQVTFDATASTCSGSAANCDAYEWDFGDSTTGTGVNVVHLYAAGGAKTVTLTVHEYGVGEATKTKTIKVYAADLPPVINSTCTFDANTWTMTVTDASTDDNGIIQESVTWGDGSLTSVLTSPPFVFNHTYGGPGFFTVTHKIIDTIGQQAQNVCLANPAYFTIGGTTYRNGGVVTLSGVKLTFVRGMTVAKTLYSNSVGAYTATNLKPGSYTIYATKVGYTFPTYNLTIGPSNTTYSIVAN